MIVDERRTVREGVARAVATVPMVRHVECVSTPDELLGRAPARRAGRRPPVDVVLVGTQRAVPVGVEAALRVLTARPWARVVVLGAADDQEGARAAVAAGAHAYLPWTSLGTALRAVLGAVAAGTFPLATPDRPDLLTEREWQVLLGMAEGQSNRQIGAALGLDESTVRTFARRLFRKLDMPDRAGAVAHAFRAGWLS